MKRGKKYIKIKNYLKHKLFRSGWKAIRYTIRQSREHRDIRRMFCTIEYAQTFIGKIVS